MKRFLALILFSLFPLFSFASNVYLARVPTTLQGVTGDGDRYLSHFSQALQPPDGITYDANTGYFRVSQSGVYVATWSLTFGNLVSSNTSGAAWIHACGYEPFIYNGNPWAESNPGGVVGGGSNIKAIVGSHVFYCDVNYDPIIWTATRISGDAKNVMFVYDSFFSIQKIG